MTDQVAEGAAPAEDAATPAVETPEVQDQTTIDAALAADETPGDDAAAQAEAEKAEQAKSRKSADVRIGELTKRMREAERRAENAERLALQARNPEPVEQAPQRPDPTQYQDGLYDPAYVEDLTAFKAQEAVAAFAGDYQRRQEQDAVARTAAEQQRAWEDRKAKAAEKFPDYADVVDASAAAGEWPCPPAMAQAIHSSEDGPSIAYHLATNQAEARRIAALPPLAQALAIGRLEATLQAVTPPKPKTASDAPLPPASQARGNGGKFKVDPSTGDFNAFEAAYGSSGRTP